MADSAFEPVKMVTPEIGLAAQCFVAFGVGLFYYLLGAVIMGTTEPPFGLLFQLISGAILTIAAMLLLLILGLPLRLLPNWKAFWKRHWWISIALGSLAFAMMVASGSWPRLQESDVPFEGSNVTDVARNVGWSGWLLTVFVVLHHYPPFLPRSTGASAETGSASTKT